MLTRRQLHLGIDLFGAAARLHLQRLRSHRLAVDDQVDDGRLIAGITDADQVGAEDVFPFARGVEVGRQRRRVEDAHLVFGAAPRLHVIAVDIEHIEFLLGRGHGPFGDHLRRGDEPLKVDRRERQHIADIIEAVARVVGWEVDGEVTVDVAKVANGVVVFRPVEAADRHLAGVHFRLGDRLTEQAFDLALQGFDLGLGGTRLAFGGRHFAGDHLGD